MPVFTDIFRNYCFMSAGIGWLLAQILKVLTGMFKELVGHTPLQVLAGAGVGLLVPILLLLTPWF